MNELKNIKYWIFDLDNTLYSGKTKVFDQVDKKMSKYISEKLNINIEEARKVQKNYFSLTLSALKTPRTCISSQCRPNSSKEFLIFFCSMCPSISHKKK